MEHLHEGVGLSSVWEALSAKVYLDDEKFVTKMTARAEQSLKRCACRAVPPGNPKRSAQPRAAGDLC